MIAPRHPSAQASTVKKSASQLTTVPCSDTIITMRVKHSPADFTVEELLGIDLATRGDYAIYQVEKRNITTHQAQNGIATALGYNRSAVQFPALKDRRSLATQYACIKGNPPPQIRGKGWRASFAGRLDRPLRPTDIAANRFVLTLRDLAHQETAQIANRLAALEAQGLPNYFDDQRFGSYDPATGFIGAHILKRDPEKALRSYLAVPFARDSRPVKDFKKISEAHWGDWDTLFAAAPQPSNYRSVLTFLRDHPSDYRKALNLIPHQLLSLYLSAYQSHIWNRIAGQYLQELLTFQKMDSTRVFGIEITGARLPVYLEIPPSLEKKLRKQTISMPHHRAVYQEPELAAAAGEVLQMEGMTLNDFKARILKKAYPSRHKRPLLLFPTELVVQEIARDEFFPGRDKLVAAFALPRGSYATLLVRCMGLA